VMEFVLTELRETIRFDQFLGGKSGLPSVWGKLLIACEEAKIRLSTRQEDAIEIDGVLCKDEKGREVESGGSDYPGRLRTE